MTKILYCIKTTEKYKSRVDAIKNTWLDGIDDYIFYSEHEDPNDNIIKVCDDGSYGGLEEKGVNFYNLIKHIEIEEGKNVLDYYDWLFMVDDDTFVNVKNLQKFAKKADTEKVYGEIFTYETHPDNPMYSAPGFKKSYKWYSGGAGVLVHTSVLSKMPEFINYKTRHDDVSIGLSFINNGVELIDSDNFNSQPPEFWGDSDLDIKTKITYHHINEERMEDLNKVLTTK
jgi:hypothetical protein